MCENTEKRFTIFDYILTFLAVFFKYMLTYKENINPNGRFTLLYIYLFILIILVFICIYRKKINKNELGRIVIFGVIATYFIVMYSEQNFLISYLLSLICLKKENSDFIKSFFVSSTICYSLTIFLHIVGFLPNVTMIRLVDGEYLQRLSLGFSHPNNVFLYWLPIVLSGYYLFHDKKMFYLISIILSCILYKFSYCRTGFYVILIFLVLSLLCKNIKMNSFKNIVPLFFVVLTVISVFIAYKYGYNYSNKISEALSGRPYFWNYYLQNGKLISLFGKNKIEGMYLDNFYIYMLVQLGLIGYTIYFILYYNSIKILKKDIRYLVIIFTFLLYGMFEANVIIGSVQFMFVIQLKELISCNNKIKLEVK